MVKHDPNCATDAHISIIGHITHEELTKLLSDTEAANGFGNRFLWVATKRARSLPFGGQLDKELLQPLIDGVQSAIDFGSQCGEIRFDEIAAESWTLLYEELSEGKGGLFGAMTARAEPQILRISTIYALLDKSDKIRIEHLNAAVAVWRYCEASAAYLFGKSVGDSTADRILSALSEAGDRGMTRTDISHGLFNKNKKSAEIEMALKFLEAKNMARRTAASKEKGRPEERWYDVRH
jgi:DNA replicative helicase MCM subunit Mcm2 (Cdc46/Mcm family)